VSGYAARDARSSGAASTAVAIRVCAVAPVTTAVRHVPGAASAATTVVRNCGVFPATQPGERRAVIVPAALGYGRAGLYSPEVAGKPRFVISPNTMLVYDVEVSGTGRE